MKIYLSLLVVILISQTCRKRVLSIARFRKHSKHTRRERHVYTNRWVVYVKSGARIVRKMAERHNFVYHGQLGSLKDFYHLEHRGVSKLSYRTDHRIHRLLSSHPVVLWSKQQTLKKRVLRGYFSDPLFTKQWYIRNNGLAHNECKNLGAGEGVDINIFPAWNRNLTGRGVVVSIIDDGIEYTHPDLRKNYDPYASYDYNDNDEDPSPRYTLDNINKHGTRCAGEVAAEMNNSICGVGVAYNAKLGGIRMLDGDITDAVEASSLGHRPEYVDIYSSSWGPDDDGKTVDGPGPLAKHALSQIIRNGRDKLGSIVVWATGNGGKFKDYCSCDGYVNSPYTISIGAVDMCGAKPWYSEECPGTLAVTYSGKAKRMAGGRVEISTTDLRGGCTTQHTGSSAAAPLAAGIFALVLEANPKLSWRDMQHLIVRTTRIVSPDDDKWQVNGAGHRVNPKFGFGILDAGALVDEATSPEWKTSQKQRSCSSVEKRVHLRLLPHDTVTTTHNATGCSDSPNCVSRLEHVLVAVTIYKREDRGKLTITLTSPSGTRSPLLAMRPRDRSPKGFVNWEFLTVFHWDESPRGVWTLAVQDNSFSEGTLNSWRLKFLGTCHKDRVKDPPIPAGPDGGGQGSGTSSILRDGAGHRTQILVFFLFFLSILKSYLNN